MTDLTWIQLLSSRNFQWPLLFANRTVGCRAHGMRVSTQLPPRSLRFWMLTTGIDRMPSRQVSTALRDRLRLRWSTADTREFEATELRLGLRCIGPSPR